MSMEMFSKICIIIIAVLFSSGVEAQGLIFNDQIYKKSQAKPHLMRGEAYKLPPNASLKEFCPPPGNQLGYATSVGWALGWSGKTILYAKNNGLRGNDIKHHVFAPAYIYQKALPKGEQAECESGISLEDGLRALKRNGTPKFTDHLHYCIAPVSEEVEAKAKEHSIDDYAKLFNLNDDPDEKVNAVKVSINEGYPVIAGVVATRSFEHAREFWQPTESPESSHIGQAVCIIGYDDSKYGGAFEILNSWGKEWGNNGFMWIRYDDFNDYVKYAYELFEVPVQDTKISGSIEFKLSTGEDMPVEMVDKGYFKMKNSYKGGETFRIYINNDDPGFLYVFGSDLTNAFFPIFPYEQAISAALNYKLSRIAIPGEDKLIKFDNTAGTDYLCVLYAREELDIHDIMNRMKLNQGDLRQKIKKAMDPTLLNNLMNWSADKVSFTGDAKEGNVVAIVVEISHH